MSRGVCNAKAARRAKRDAYLPSALPSHGGGGRPRPWRWRPMPGRKRRCGGAGADLQRSSPGVRAGACTWPATGGNFAVAALARRVLKARPESAAIADRSGARPRAYGQNEEETAP